MSVEQLLKQKEHKVTQKDLPLCCPTPEMTEWNMHPRVFLSFANGNEATCPYCGKKYILSEDD